MLRRVKQLLVALSTLSVVVACGARSGLRDGDRDAGVDASIDAPLDAGTDASIDAPEDAAEDVIEDWTPPPVDGLAPCDPEDLFVYLVTSEETLYRYDPGTGEVKLIGNLDCPISFGSPFSMGVSRSGTAYVLYRPLGDPGIQPPGKLYAVNVLKGTCVATTYQPGKFGFNLFGMGFAIDDDGLGETLYVAHSGTTTTPSQGLASIDVNTYELTPIAPFTDAPGHRMELTSSDDGKLYGYVLDPGGNGGYIVRIDKQTAQIVESTPVAAGNDAAFAFAYWGGDFYTFTGPNGGPTTITRYRPIDGTVTKVGSVAKTVVGAGVSTCSVK